tara:strand:- start:1366 stop:2742 length:1377 start_codon:yes stop_codon:yes gene_type:complete
MTCLHFSAPARTIISGFASALLFLLTGCVTTDGGSSQYVDMKTPVFQKRTDMMIEAFEKGCLDRRIDEVIAAGSAMDWPGRQVSMPVRPHSNTKASVTSLANITFAPWNRNLTGSPDKFLREVLKAQIADSPYAIRCHQQLLDVDYDRLLQAMRQTSYLGLARNWRQEKYGLLETQYYFTFPQDIPVVLSIITQSNTIKPNEQWCNNSTCGGYGFNEARLELTIGLPSRQMPAVTIRQLLNEMSLVASDGMRKLVAETTADIQTGLSGYHQGIASKNNARRAEIQRNYEAAVARTNRNTMSNSQVFASALNQSLQNMQRQQKAFADINRQVGAVSNSQQRLDNAARRTQEYYGDDSANSSGSNSGNSSGPTLTSACPKTYVAPPAKYASEWPPLRYGCDQPYKSEAEVHTVFAGWVSKREASDADRTARIRAQQDATARSKASAVKDKQKCTGCTVSK